MTTPELHRRGGTERSTWEHLARWRDLVDLRAYTVSNGREAPPGIEVRRVPAVPSPHLAFWMSWVVACRIRRLVDAFLGGAPDAIVSPGINAGDADVIGVHLLFARLRDAAASSAPSASMLRSMHRQAYFAAVGALERRVYRGPATVYAVSRRDADEIEARFDRPRGSVPVVAHGVDADAFSPDRRIARRVAARDAAGIGDRRVVLLLGNEPTVKGFDLAIAALVHLPGDVVLALGGRFDRAQVSGWIDDGRVGGRVVVLEHASEPIERFAIADVAIAPSRQDSFNLPALEALACGLPIVVSDATGIAEHVGSCPDATVLGSPVDPRTLADAILASLDVGPDGSGRDLARSMTWDESARSAASIVRREVGTPRVLVLATDAGRTGGIQRATRTLVRAAAEAYGGERVGVSSVWSGDIPVPGRAGARGRPAHRRGQGGSSAIGQVRDRGDGRRVAVASSTRDRRLASAPRPRRMAVSRDQRRSVRRLVPRHRGLGADRSARPRLDRESRPCARAERVHRVPGRSSARACHRDRSRSFRIRCLPSSQSALRPTERRARQGGSSRWPGSTPTMPTRASTRCSRRGPR